MVLQDGIHTEVATQWQSVDTIFGFLRDEVEGSTMTDTRVEDMSSAHECATGETVEDTSAQLDGKGVHRPIKDDLVQDGYEHRPGNENRETKTDENKVQDRDGGESFSWRI